MSGREVVSGTYNSARSTTKVSETFDTVQRRLPIIRHFFQRRKNKLEPGNDHIPSDACDAMEKTLGAHEEEALKLREILEKDAQGPGKGNTVGELLAMATLTQNITNNNAANSVTPEQKDKFEDILQVMKSIQSSAAKKEPLASAFTSSGGAQTNNVNSDDGRQINTAHVECQYIITNESGKDKGDEEAYTSDSSDDSEDSYFSRVKCYSCKEYGHYSNDCPKKSKNSNFFPGNCHYCNIYGHMRKDCPKEIRCYRCENANLCLFHILFRSLILGTDDDPGHYEKSYTKRNDDCFDCGRKGHWAADCNVPQRYWLR